MRGGTIFGNQASGVSSSLANNAVGIGAALRVMDDLPAYSMTSIYGDGTNIGGNIINESLSIQYRYIDTTLVGRN